MKPVVINQTPPKVVEPTPEPPTPLPPAPPDKRVVIECRNERWSIHLENDNPSTFFTDRDFNQLERLLRIKRAEIKRQAFILYRRNQQVKADLEKNLTNKVVTSA
jgi:hypothetical protein